MYNLLLLFLQTKTRTTQVQVLQKQKSFPCLHIHFFQKQLLQHRGQKFHLLQKKHKHTHFSLQHKLSLLQLQDLLL